MFVTLRTGGRMAALAVEAVIGVASLPAGSLEQLPPLLREADADMVSAIGTHDAALMFVPEQRPSGATVGVGSVRQAGATVVMASPPPTDLERFRATVERLLGLKFDDNRLESLADALERLAAGRSPELYLQRLDGATPGSDDVRALARELTVGETYFFRNIDQFHAFAEVVLPERLAANASSRRLRLLSAGCASGEEPYSLSMLVRPRVDPSWDVTIVGIDVNSRRRSSACAALGRYSSWSLRETPADVQARWFSKIGHEFALSDTIRRAVRFEERNLAESHDGAPRDGDVRRHLLPERTHVLGA